MTNKSTKILILGNPTTTTNYIKYMKYNICKILATI